MTFAGAAALLLLSLATALRFRRLPPPTDLRAMTWDAAQHALIGLDLFDHIRRFEPLLLLARLQAEHWWPPLFGILSLPAWLAGGRELTSPSLVSFAGYVLLPAIVWIGVRRTSKAVPLFAAAMAALLCLRSPQFIEMSAWSMLELAAALFAAGSLALFLARAPRARNWAYGLAGASTFLKYHYGFFLLVTLGVATVVEMGGAERRRAAHALWSRLRLKSVWIPLAVVAAAVIAKVASVPTLLWAAYFVAFVAVLVRLDRARRFWGELPEPLRRFARYGLIWPAIAFLDLSNAQAWYRQLRVETNPPATLAVQLHELRRYLTDDYFHGWLLLFAAIAGLVLCAVEGIRRRRVDVTAVALHAVWPVALMMQSSYRIESRFLATAAAALILAAVVGWTLLLERMPRPRRIALAAAVLVLLAVDQTLQNDEWKTAIAKRRVYGYLSSDPPASFVDETVRAFSRGEPVLILLPRDIEVVAPTVRLGLRIAMPNVRPDRVVVRGGGEQRLASRLRRFPGGLVGVEADEASLRRVAAESGMDVVSVARGPSLPDGRRALLIARVAASR